MIHLVLASILMVQDGRETPSPQPVKVDNPAYKAWCAFKPGSWVMLKFETRVDGAVRAEGQNRLTLKSVEADHLVIETKASTTYNGEKVELKPREIRVEAKIVPESDASKTVVAEGEEEIEVGGRKIKCRWAETKEKLLTTEQWDKTWTSSGVPGGLVRSEDRTDSAPIRATKTWVDSFESK